MVYPDSCGISGRQMNGSFQISNLGTYYSFIYIGLSHVILLQLVLNFQEF